MNSQRLLDTFFELVRIDSPSRSEAQVAAYASHVLEGMGFTVTFDDSSQDTGSDTGNLIAHLPGTKEGHIVLSAHMDCVDPCLGIEPVTQGEKIVSAGDTILGADDKAGIAAIFEAVRSVLEAGDPRPDITVLFTVCEELSLVGARHLRQELLPQDVPCFVFDADGKPGTIILGAPYHYTLRACFSGKAAHAGVEPEKGVSAIQMAAAAVEAMDLGRIDEHTTANIGLIGGGHEVNIVADACGISGECRSLYEEKVEAQKESMTAACKQAAAHYGGEVDISWKLDYPGLLYSEDDPLVVSLAKAAQAAGLAPAFAYSGGGADSNLLQEKGLRAITLGIGMTGFHSLEEYILVKDLEDTARFAETIIKRCVK